MDVLPRRPSGSGAIGLFPNGGLKSRVNGRERVIATHTGIHLEASDFNGLQMPFYEVYDAQGGKHTISVNDHSVLFIDENEYIPRLLLESPNGSQYELQVDDEGVLKVVLVNV